MIVASVDQLPLKDATAVHKFKLLAGPRWTPNPPADAGVSGLRTWDNGFIKISCEDFPKPAMNLKWASDALDRLITEANVSRSKPPESSSDGLDCRAQKTPFAMSHSTFGMCIPRRAKPKRVTTSVGASLGVRHRWTFRKSGYRRINQCGGRRDLTM